jgi:hypothetical protein
LDSLDSLDGTQSADGTPRGSSLQVVEEVDWTMDDVGDDVGDYVGDVMAVII